MITLISKFVVLQASYPGIALIIASALKSAAIVLTASGVVSLLQARSARARCWIWRCSLVGIMVLLLWDFGPAVVRSARFVLPVQPESVSRQPLFITVPASELAKRDDDVGVANKIFDPPVSDSAPEPSIQAIVIDAPNRWSISWFDVERCALRFWGWGSALFIATTAIRLVAGRIWLKRHGLPAGVRVRKICRQVATDLGIKSEPRVWINQQLHSPLLVGVTRPCIYLPDTIRSAGPNGLLSVFLHELAHWIRRDTLWHYLGKLAVCSFWWNPLVLLAAQRMRAEAEEAADDWVLKQGIAPDSYATALVQIASTAEDLRPSTVGVSMLGYRSLHRRIQAMLQSNPWRGKLGWRGVAAIALSTCLFLLLVTMYVQAAGADQAVHFRFRKPEAKAVFLAGDFDDWSTSAIPMRRDAGGEWSADVPLPPGQYTYKFVADGEWFADPANPEETPNRFATQDSVLIVKARHGERIDCEKETMLRQVALLFANDEYGTLDTLANSLRSTQARFADGSWKLRTLYEALEPAQYFTAGEDWDVWFGKMAEWNWAVPDSITAPVVEAQGWARYAQKPTDEAEHARRRQKIKDILFAAASRSERCPQWFALMIDAVAIPDGWPEEEFKLLLADGARCGRDYHSLYLEAAWYKPTGQCGWYGKEASWPQKVEKFSREFDPEEGLTSYSRLAWRRSTWFGNLFEESPVDWSKVKQGFRDIDAHYPNSRADLNTFCQLALVAGDKETARALYQRIGEEGDESWASYARYRLWRDWADPATPAWRTTPKLTARPPGQRHNVHSVAFSPDGKTLLSCNDANEVILWDVPTGAAVWQASFGEHPARSVAFSPDGRMFAASGFQDNVEHERGLVRVWSTDSQREIARLRPDAGNFLAVAFLPDNRRLAIVGGDGPEKCAGYIWDVVADRVRALNFPSSEKRAAMSVSVSPDSRTLLVSCYRSIIFYDLVEDRVLSVKHTTRNFTRSAAFSPDGKVAVTAGTPNSRRVAAPGTVSFWDMPSCSEKDLRIDDGTGGVFTVAFSRDGKLLAGAGMDQTVHVWEAKTAKSKAVFLGHDHDVTTVAFSPDNKTIASAGGDGAIKFWQMPQ